MPAVRTDNNGNEHAIPPYVLGLDVGTQSLRAALVDLHGRTVAYGVAPIETTYPRPTWAEQQPLAWWSAARQAVRHGARPRKRQARAGRRHRPRLHGLHGRGLRPRGRPLRPALLWMDQRAFREADEISATGDPILRYVSGRVSPEWMLPKALWLKRNEPEIYDQADRIVECTDWMMFRLTGEWTLVAEPCRGQMELRAARWRLAQVGCSRALAWSIFWRNGRLGSCRWAKARRD